MSSLMRWDPRSDVVSLRDMMDRLFEDSFVRPRVGMMGAQASDLAVDMYETKDELIVQAAVPGVKPEDLDLTITGDMLTIRGESKQEHETKEENYIQRERRYGTFTRTIQLPPGLKTDKAEASFDNGVLTLKLPKSEQIKPKTIQIKPKR